MSRSGQLWKFVIAVLLVFLPLQTIHAQHLVKLRSAVNTGGSSGTISISNHAFIVQQSIGQPGAIGPHRSGTILLRQGFIQPPGGSDSGILQGKALITVAPNPFSSGINISCSDTITGELYITLYDIYGNAVCNKKQGATGEFYLDLSMFSPGIYVLKVRTGSAYIVAKLIKE